MIKNKYGYFTDDHREFVITDPQTPRPWFNYMWNEHYGGLISHTGGGFSFLDCPRDNRLNRMRYNSLPWDRPGRYVIVKDSNTKDYWSLSWAPTIDKKYDLYECRHGQGYTKIKTQKNEIEGSITYFVPTDKNCEVWRVSLKNNSQETKSLEIYSFTELMMGNALNDIINQPNDKHFTDIKFDKINEALIATRRYWVLNKKVSVAQPNIDWEYNLLFTSTLPVTGFDGSLDKFIGKWRSEANPIAIESGKMCDTEITAGDPVAALQSKIDLAPNEQKEFAIIMTVVPKNEDPLVSADLEKLKSISYLDDSFNTLKSKWNNHLSKVNVITPDEKFNAMINVWNKYQTAVTFDMARNSGYYHGGLLFGTGMRDQFQDILGTVITEPERVRARLLNALKYQFCDGSTLHNFFKLTGSGERTHHSDTPLWIPFGIVEYLNETGDFSILNEIVEYHDSDDDTVYNHLIKALKYALRSTTERGLPKMMNGDWNDTLDHIGPHGKGETVWGAAFLAHVINKCFELFEYKKDDTALSFFKDEYAKLKNAINEICWDGKWYLRAFRDNGIPIGSSKDKQGQIFLNAQTWPVIAGVANKERAESSLQACVEMLENPYGMQICYPSYTKIDDTVGLISRCVPGKKENGAIFNHASSWFVLASIVNGDKEKAYEIYSKMMPLNSSKNIDRYEVEPYVYAEYLTSPDHETENQASHSWLTGSAVWMYRIGLDYILGFQTKLSGLNLNPQIPNSWDKCEYSRVFRGKVFNIKVLNPQKSYTKINNIIINGKESDNNFINPKDYFTDEINVEINLV
jgi:cellobiose phosphorylase